MSDDALITCPNCGHRFPVSEALSAQIRAELEVSLRKGEAERVKQAAAAVEAQVRAETELQLRELRDNLTAQKQRTQKAQEAELALRKEKTALEERSRELDLEVARKLDAAKTELETGIRKTVVAEQDLKLKEKDKKISDLLKDLVHRGESTHAIS